MEPLKPQHEAFCRAYAVAPSGAEAARAAGYSLLNARQQAFRLLQRPDIVERLTELGADLGARRDDAVAALLAKLDPVYRANLRAGRHERVLQTVELQARIAGVLPGGSTIQPRPEGTSVERIQEMIDRAIFRVFNQHLFPENFRYADDRLDEEGIAYIQDDEDAEFLSAHPAMDDAKADVHGETLDETELGAAGSDDAAAWPPSNADR